MVTFDHKRSNVTFDTKRQFANKIFMEERSSEEIFIVYLYIVVVVTTSMVYRATFQNIFEIWLELKLKKTGFSSMHDSKIKLYLLLVIFEEKLLVDKIHMPIYRKIRTDFILRWPFMSKSKGILLKNFRFQLMEHFILTKL